MMEPWTCHRFTYTREQVIKLVKCYQCSRKTTRVLSSALICAFGMKIFDERDWLSVLEILEKIKAQDEEAEPQDVAESDQLGQWINEGLYE